MTPDRLTARLAENVLSHAEQEQIDAQVPLRRYCPGCGTWLRPGEEPGTHETVELPARLWIYTNYDCNFSCTYCLAMSSPRAERRGLGLEVIRQLLEEAEEMGFAEVYFTGGEPMLLPDLPEILEAAAARFPTTVLTNASLARGERLERLRVVGRPELVFQVSLDGAEPESNDAYRGVGTWAQAMRGIENLLAAGLNVRISTTETPSNVHEISAIKSLVRSLGIRSQDHFVRPLIQRGFSDEGLVLDRAELVPELTLSRDGAFWHAGATEEDLRVSDSVLPVRSAMNRLVELYQSSGSDGRARPFR